MEVILRQAVDNLGHPGDLVKALTDFLEDPTEQPALWEATGT